MPKHKVHIMVICVTEARKQFQKQQFTTLNLPYNITYAQAYTPENSRPYITDYDTLHPEYDTTICCMRSHVGVLNWFYNNTDSDYVLVVEDDVAFVKSGLLERIEHTIDLFEAHQDMIDYVNLGYLISPQTGLYPSGQYKDRELHWGKQEDPVWGMQAYIIKRPIVKQIIDICHQPNTATLRAKAKEYVASGHRHSSRYIRIQADAIFPMLFRQGFIQPVLAIELPFKSIIDPVSPVNERLAKAIQMGTIVLSDFYSC